MKYKKIIIIFILAVFLFSLSFVCASDANDTATASENIQLIEQADDEFLSVENDLDVLNTNPSTYSKLSDEIGSGGNIELKHDYYTYDSGSTIRITTDNSVINGNGAIIDMAGSNIRAFAVSASGVTIKNLTIKNANNSRATIAYYTSLGGAIYMGSGTITNCNFVNNTADMGGAIFVTNGNIINCNFFNNTATKQDSGAICMYSGTVENCNFVNNTAERDGGAIFVTTNGNVTNCNFVNNTAERDGGAINMGSGTITNCNFVNNTAYYNGGAISVTVKGNVANCNFTGNNAVVGSAIYYSSISWNNTVSNSVFLNNKADADADTPFQIVQNENRIEITFMGQDNLLNAIYSNDDVSFTNVTYWGANGIANTGKSAAPSRSNREAGQNITVVMFVNDSLVLNVTKVTDDNGTIVLDGVDGNYIIIVSHDADSYYAEAETLISGIQYYANMTPVSTLNKTVNITAKSNIKNEIIQREFLFILPNGTEISANYNADGTWWAIYSFDDYGNYNVKGSYINGVTINNATISIGNKVPINVNDVSILYGNSANIVASVPEAINGQKIIITVNKISKKATVKKGEAKAVFTDLPAGNYEIVVEYLGDHFNSVNSTTAKLTVQKATPDISVSADNVLCDGYLTVTVQMPSDATRRPTVTIGNQSKIVTMRNGTGTAKFSGLNVGTYDVVASYNGDANYRKASANTSLKVNNAILKVSANAITYGDVLVVDVQLPSDATRRPTVTIGNQSKLVTMRNGTGTAKFSGLDVGTHTIVASYGGDGKYDSILVNASVKVERIASYIIVSADDINSNEDLIVNIKLPSDVSRRATVTVGNESKFVSLTNGIASVKFSGLSVGNHTIAVSYSGDGNYDKAYATTTVKVNWSPEKINVVAKPVIYGEDVIVDIQVPDDVTGSATVAIGDETKTVNLTKGSGSAQFAGLDAGNHTVTVTYNGNAKYTGSVSVAKATPDIKINPSTIFSSNYRYYYAGMPQKVIVKLPDDVARRAIVTLDNVTKYATLNNGEGSVLFKRLSIGTHELQVSYAGDANYKKASKIITITVIKPPEEEDPFAPYDEYWYDEWLY